MKKGRHYIKKQMKKSLYFGLIIIGMCFILTKSVIYSFLLLVSMAVAFLVYSYVKSRLKENKLKKSGIHDIDCMDGIQFEHYLSVLFKGLGYSVEVTKSTGDFGADLILKKDHDKIVVQAKRYKNKVGIKAIQEISASRLHYGATQSWVVFY